MYTAHWWIISSLNKISQNMSSSLGVFYKFTLFNDCQIYDAGLKVPS